MKLDILILDDLVVRDSFYDINREALKACHLTKQNMLLHKEETLRQKSRVVWLKAGDENTKYFYNYANMRQLTNFVWEVIDLNRKMVF